jgi:hypothetical protein
MTCVYQSQSEWRHVYNCALGYYGGRPLVGNCLACARKGDNTPAHAAELAARADRAHPANRPRLSGCCDRADQA